MTAGVGALQREHREVLVGQPRLVAHLLVPYPRRWLRFSFVFAARSCGAFGAGGRHTVNGCGVVELPVAPLQYLRSLGGARCALPCFLAFFCAFGARPCGKLAWKGRFRISRRFTGSWMKKELPCSKIRSSLSTWSSTWRISRTLSHLQKMVRSETEIILRQQKLSEKWLMSNNGSSTTRTKSITWRCLPRAVRFPRRPRLGAAPC